MNNHEVAEVLAELKAVRDELSRIRDERAIEQLVLGYGPRVDSVNDDDRAEALALMWVEDGEYDIGGVGVRHGRKEIAETYRTRHFANVVEGIAHVMGAPSVEVRGDSAVAFNYSCVFRPQGADFFPWRVSVNEWHLTRTTEGWRVARRVNRMVDGGEVARRVVDDAALRSEASA